MKSPNIPAPVALNAYRIAVALLLVTLIMTALAYHHEAQVAAQAEESMEAMRVYTDDIGRDAQRSIDAARAAQARADAAERDLRVVETGILLLPPNIPEDATLREVRDLAREAGTPHRYWGLRWGTEGNSGSPVRVDRSPGQ